MRYFLFFLIFIFFISVFLFFNKTACEKPYITFTFDDGYRDHFYNAFPILQKYNIKAVAFIPVELVGNYFENQSLMNWNEIAELKREGWDIESHGISHKDLTRLKTNNIIYELNKSKSILKERGFDGNILAIPYGKYNSRIKEVTKKYYNAARPSWEGYNSFNTLDRFDLKSHWFVNSTSISEMKSWVDKTLENNVSI